MVAGRTPDCRRAPRTRLAVGDCRRRRRHASGACGDCGARTARSVDAGLDCRTDACCTASTRRRRRRFSCSRATSPRTATVRLEGTGATARSPRTSRRTDGPLVFVGYTPDGYDLFTTAAGVSRVDAGQRRSGSSGPRRSTGARRHVRRRRARAGRDLHTSANARAARTGRQSSCRMAARRSFGAATSWRRRARPPRLRRRRRLGGVARARPTGRSRTPTTAGGRALRQHIRRHGSRTESGESRSREVNAGAVFPWSHVRWAQSVARRRHAATDTLDCPDCAATACDLRAERRSICGAATRSARRGATATRSAAKRAGRSRRPTSWIAQWLGSDGDAGSIVADLRGYHRAGSRHSVIAARAAPATSWGDDNVRREFTDGGHGPRPIGFDFGSDAIGLLRGFDEDVRGRACGGRQCRLPVSDPARSSAASARCPFRAHDARRAVRRRRPCVGRDVPRPTTPASRSAPSCRPTPFSATRCR